MIGYGALLYFFLGKLGKARKKRCHCHWTWMLGLGCIERRSILRYERSLNTNMAPKSQDYFHSMSIRIMTNIYSSSTCTYFQWDESY